MSSILDQTRRAISPQIMQSVSSLIGESPTATSKGLSAALPALLAGVTNMASTPSGGERVQSLISDGNYGGGMLSNFDSLLGGGGATDGLLRSGGHLLTSLFGSRETDVTDSVARSADMPRSSASKLMAIAAPIVMAVLGREISTRGLGVSGLTQLLAGERSLLAALLPASLAGILGFKIPSILTTDTPARDRLRTRPAATAYRPDDEPVVPRAAGGWRWWPTVAAALAALALLFLYGRSQAPKVAQTDQPAPSASPREMTGSAPTPALPSAPQSSAGTPDVKEGSFLQKFSAFMADPSDTSLPKRFVFDDLNFETGTATLTPASQATVDQLASILTSHPSVQVTLEGHTDSTGNAAANKKLSQERAAAVKAKLVEDGIGAERIRTAGFGQERPLASNDSEDGRARNRRTELVVMRR